MLMHPTHDRLVALGLTGMAKSLEEQRQQPDVAALAFEERLALMVDREAIERLRHLDLAAEPAVRQSLGIRNVEDGFFRIHDRGKPVEKLLAHVNMTRGAHADAAALPDNALDAVLDGGGHQAGAGHDVDGLRFARRLDKNNAGHCAGAYLGWDSGISGARRDRGRVDVPPAPTLT